MKLRLVSALAAIYLIWGSTFLATRFALGAFPPLLLVCLRCTGGALLLGTYGGWRGRWAASSTGSSAGPAAWGASLGVLLRRSHAWAAPCGATGVMERERGRPACRGDDA